MKPEVVVKEALVKEYLKETVEKLRKEHDFNMYVNGEGHVIFDEPMPIKNVFYKIMRELLKELAVTKAELWITQSSFRHHNASP